MDTNTDIVDHKMLYDKMVEHDNQILGVVSDIHGINVKLDPIARGVTSVALGFKAVLWFGAISIAVVAMFELYHQFYPGI